MEGLARIELYNIDNYMEAFDGNELLRHLLMVNNVMLDGIERRFISLEVNNKNEQSKELVRSQYKVSVEEFRKNLKDNIERLSTEVDLNDEISNKLMRDIRKILTNKGVLQKSDEVASRFLFDKLIYILSKYNNLMLRDFELPMHMRRNLNRTPVFLSYAYDDRLYTLSLFNFMYRNGIYLYVDWMHQGRENDGIILKNNITEELKQSKQLLFMRTVNSELKIETDSKSVIRPW